MNQWSLQLVNVLQHAGATHLVKLGKQSQMVLVSCIVFYHLKMNVQQLSVVVVNHALELVRIIEDAKEGPLLVKNASVGIHSLHMLMWISLVNNKEQLGITTAVIQMMLLKQVNNGAIPQLQI